MKEYIEKDKPFSLLKNYLNKPNGQYNAQEIVYLVDDLISDIPAADVVEVRHGTPIRHFMRFCNSDGEVIREIMDGWECPFCHNTGAENYCPNCGAKMDGGADDAAD